MSGQNAQLHVVMEKEQEQEHAQMDARTFKLMIRITILMRLKLATNLHVRKTPFENQFYQFLHFILKVLHRKMLCWH